MEMCFHFIFCTHSLILQRKYVFIIDFVCDYTTETYFCQKDILEINKKLSMWIYECSRDGFGQFQDPTQSNLINLIWFGFNNFF